MAFEPFVWGQGGQRLSPQEAARQREMAKALMGQNSSVAQNPWEGLAQVARAFTGTQLDARADAAEEAGRAELAQLLAGVGPDTDMSTLMSIYGNGWANPQEQAIAELLINQDMRKQQVADERAYQAHLLADQRAYDQPVRDAEMEKLLLGNEAAALELEQLKNPAPVLPEAPKTTTIFDPATGRDQVVQWNAQIGNWEPVGGIQAPAEPLVQVSTGDNSSAFLKKADENAAERLNTIISEGNGAGQFMGDIQQLAALGSQIGTGKGAEIVNQLGPYAQALGFDIGGLDEIQAYQAIVDRLAPQMRPAGSGPGSDFDARQFLSSLPSLGRTPGGNKLITDTFTAIQQNKMAAAEIAALSMQPPEAGGITWQEAEKHIRALPNPYEIFKQARRDGEVETSTPGQSAQDKSLSQSQANPQIFGGAGQPSGVVDYSDYFR